MTCSHHDIPPAHHVRLIQSKYLHHLIEVWHVLTMIYLQLIMLGWYKASIFIISLKYNMFSPWYNYKGTWKFAHLASNNDHSHSCDHLDCQNKTRSDKYLTLIRWMTPKFKRAFLNMNVSKKIIIFLMSKQEKFSNY